MNGMSYTQPLAARSGTPLAAVHNSCSIFIDDTRVDNIQDGTKTPRASFGCGWHLPPGHRLVVALTPPATSARSLKRSLVPYRVCSSCLSHFSTA
jgi:hypothetical protein